MLQRIQTIYLLLIVALFTATLFMPLAVLQMGELFYSFDASGLHTMSVEPELVYPTWGLFALVAIIALVAMVTIFLYKNRILQIRLSIFNALLMIGFYAFFFYIIWTLKGQAQQMFTMQVKLAVGFPLISLILDYLAIRNIGADETLVRSLNRLR